MGEGDGLFRGFKDFRGFKASRTFLAEVHYAGLGVVLGVEAEVGVGLGAELGEGADGEDDPILGVGAEFDDGGTVGVFVDVDVGFLDGFAALGGGEVNFVVVADGLEGGLVAGLVEVDEVHGVHGCDFFGGGFEDVDFAASADEAPLGLAVEPDGCCAALEGELVALGYEGSAALSAHVELDLYCAFGAECCCLVENLLGCLCACREGKEGKEDGDKFFHFVLFIGLMDNGVIRFCIFAFCTFASFCSSRIGELEKF